MASDSPRILELRRRVQADPASIAFAQLAEECRRAGEAGEAVSVCRAGLARHPGYLSARVTLGRALIELGQLDEAETELATVDATAPDNLAAIRGLAEIHQQRGSLEAALSYYRRALQLARHDPDLEDSVERISRAIAPRTPAPDAPNISVEKLFDFDTLLKQLGEQPPPHVAQSPTAAPPPSVLDAVELAADDPGALAVAERELRERAEQRAADDKAARLQQAAQRQAMVVEDLESWLVAIIADRQTNPSA